jgi:hypothetical protein
MFNVQGGNPGIPKTRNDWQVWTRLPSAPVLSKVEGPRAYFDCCLVPIAYLLEPPLARLP